MKHCVTCGIEITDYWDYLSDYFPKFSPPRDRSQDMELWGIVENVDGQDKFYCFCSKEHRKEYLGVRDEQVTVSEGS